MDVVMHRSTSARLARLGLPGLDIRHALDATGVTLVRAWRSRVGRSWVLAAATSTAGAVALSAYLIRVVNRPLLEGSQPLAEGKRRELVSTGIVSTRSGSCCSRSPTGL